MLVCIATRLTEKDTGLQAGMKLILIRFLSGFDSALCSRVAVKTKISNHIPNMTGGCMSSSHSQRFALPLDLP